MFEQKSLNKIDGDYFNIIIADSQDVTIQSRNRSNWQPLCEHHHNVKTMTEDRFKEYRF